MPGYSVPIKERMMYSSCRNAVVDVIEKTLNIPLEKKVEVSSGSELTEEYLQVHLSLLIIILTHILPRESCTQWSALTGLSFPSHQDQAGETRGSLRLLLRINQ